jgi:8-oxo-dGTP pyrophosphatase MutT (NUDIX family)
MRVKIAKTAGAMFINCDGAVLLGLRSTTKRTWPGYWDIIGGHVEDGETMLWSVSLKKKLEWYRAGLN